jgi:phosphoribosylamine---glycine ligase
MNVAVIGNGGREHALCWKLAQSSKLTKLFCLPGNPGTAKHAENVAIDPMDFRKVVDWCKKNEISLVVVGPEDPLAGGIVDALQKAGIRAFGPNGEAAQLEADKWFAKELMRQQAVPTAEAKSFTNYRIALEHVEARGAPLVIKAAGLAKGKGVTVAFRTEDAVTAITQIMKDKVFGDAGARVVVEEMLTGPEVSVLALVSGNSIYILPPCQDHKPVDDGNTGPMTGGMGAFCPTPTLTPALLSQVERDVFIPILDGLRRDGIEYRGVLYAGLMLTPAGPRVLEFNVRFGDPETQPLMMRLKSDLLDVLNAVVDGKLDEAKIEWDPRPALCVVATSKGYPGPYTTSVEIHGLDGVNERDVQVFHSGTKRFGASTQTNGGRVLAVTAIGDTMEAARTNAYTAMETIEFEGMHYRKDIGRIGPM